MTYSGEALGDTALASNSDSEIVVEESATITQAAGTGQSSDETAFVGGGATLSASAGATELSASSGIATESAGVIASSTTIEGVAGDSSENTAATEESVSTNASGRVLGKFGESGNEFFNSNEENVTNAAHSQSVSFRKNYQDPVLVSHIETQNGGQPIDTKATDVTSDSATVFSIEPDLEGHNDEWFGFVTMEAGHYTTQEGHDIEAQNVEIDTYVVAGDSNPSGRTIEFEESFDVAPLIFANPRSHNSGEFSTAWINNVGQDSFELAQMVDTSNPQVAETMSWIAVDPGIEGELGQALIETTRESSTSTSYNLFDNSPDAITDWNSAGDFGFLRGDGISPSSHNFQLERGSGGSSDYATLAFKRDSGISLVEETTDVTESAVRTSASANTLTATSTGSTVDAPSISSSIATVSSTTDTSDVSDTSAITITSHGLTYLWYDTQEYYNTNGHPATKSEFDEFFEPRNSGVSFGDSGPWDEPLNWGSRGEVRPSFLPEDGFSFKVEATFIAPESGTFEFGVDGDDAIDLIIDGQSVASWYNAHGTAGDYTSHSGTISLTEGEEYSFVARQEEGGGGEAFSIGWNKPSDSSFSTMPADPFVRDTGLVTEPAALSTDGPTISTSISSVSGASDNSSAQGGATLIQSIASLQQSSQTTSAADASVTTDAISGPQPSTDQTSSTDGSNISSTDGGSIISDELTTAGDSSTLSASAGASTIGTESASSSESAAIVASIASIDTTVGPSDETTSSIDESIQLSSVATTSQSNEEGIAGEIASLSQSTSNTVATIDTGTTTEIDDITTGGVASPLTSTQTTNAVEPSILTTGVATSKQTSDQADTVVTSGGLITSAAAPPLTTVDEGVTIEATLTTISAGIPSISDEISNTFEQSVRSTFNSDTQKADSITTAIGGAAITDSVGTINMSAEQAMTLDTGLPSTTAASDIISSEIASVDDSSVITNSDGADTISAETTSAAEGAIITTSTTESVTTTNIASTVDGSSFSQSITESIQTIDAGSAADGAVVAISDTTSEQSVEDTSAVDAATIITSERGSINSSEIASAGDSSSLSTSVSTADIGAETATANESAVINAAVSTTGIISGTSEEVASAITDGSRIPSITNVTNADETSLALDTSVNTDSITVTSISDEYSSAVEEAIDTNAITTTKDSIVSVKVLAIARKSPATIVTIDAFTSAVDRPIKTTSSDAALDAESFGIALDKSINSDALSNTYKDIVTLPTYVYGRQRDSDYSTAETDENGNDSVTTGTGSETEDVTDNDNETTETR